MKVRIGLGTSGVDAAHLGEFVAALEDHAFDSLWVPDTLTRPGADPLVAMAFAAAEHPRLKIGTTMVLPGRNPVRLAKQLATLDVLSAGRLLVTFVAGLGVSPDREVIGVEIGERLAEMERLLGLLRRLLSGEAVDFPGPIGRVEGVRIAPLPVQRPLEFWLGGAAQASLELCGRAGDGWLPGLCPPEKARIGRLVIEEEAARAGRAISPEHFGVSIGYAREELAADVRQSILARTRRPASADLIPVGPAALRRCLESFIEVGFSKFVLRPISPVASWDAELAALASEVGDLQT